MFLDPIQKRALSRGPTVFHRATYIKLGLDRTGHMIFLTGQVLPDRLWIFSPFLHVIKVRRPGRRTSSFW